ncbi:MAG: hypothetical protein Q4D02_07565 [Clostridia bacterium]|nr:hypothetical protein [Clostridia bacterium]
MSTLSKTLRNFGFSSISEVITAEMQLNLKTRLNNGYKKKAIILKLDESHYNISYHFTSCMVESEKELLAKLQKLFGNLADMEAIVTDTVVLLMQLPDTKPISSLS